MKDFDQWNTRKKQVQESEFSDFVHGREVWWCALCVNVGVEADGKHGNFERPVLILRKFSKDAVLIVALSSRLKANRYHVAFRHGDQEYAAVGSQIRLMSTKRLLRRMYVMDERIFDEIRDRARRIV